MRKKEEGAEDDYQDQVDLVGNIIPTLYEVLDEDQSDGSRKVRLAQIRAAIGVALYKHFAAPVVAEALGVHRDSITQYKKKHSKNLREWKGYDDTFLVVQCTLDSTLDVETTKTNIEILSRRILKLVQTRNKLVSL